MRPNGSPAVRSACRSSTGRSSRNRKTCWHGLPARREQGDGRPMAPLPAAPENAGASASPASSFAARQQAVELVRQARQAIAAGQLDQAEWLARQAEQLRVPDTAFAPGEDRPGLVLFDSAAVAAASVAGRGAGRRTSHPADGRQRRDPTAARYAPCTTPAMTRRET